MTIRNYHRTTTGADRQDREFEAIERALSQVHLVGFTHKAPERLIEGQVYLAPGAPAWNPGAGRGLYLCIDGIYKRLDVTGNTLLGVYDQVTDTPTLNCAPNPQQVLPGDFYICTANGACSSACANIAGLTAGPGDEIVWSGTAWELIATSQAFLSSITADTAQGHITLFAGGTCTPAPTISTHIARKLEVDAAISHSDASDTVQDGRLDLLETSFGIAVALSIEKQEITIRESAGVLYADVEALGGGDMNYLMEDDQIATLNCTTGAGAGGKATIELAAGENENSPIVNYLYVTNVGAVAALNKTETIYPAGNFAWVGKVHVADAATVTSVGPYALQRFTEAFQHGGRGALSHQREKLRILGAVYATGGAHNLLIDDLQSPNSVHLNVAAAVVYQLHRQAFPAFSTGPYYLGNGQTPYAEVQDLNEILTDANGDSMANGYFNLVFWGAVNQSPDTCKLFVNLPTEAYSNQGQAIADVNETADYTLPPDMRTVGFLICRAVLRHRSAGGGTWEEDGLFSLLGTQPGVRAGGSGAVASNDFSDLFFRISDDDDETSKIAFEAGPISPSNVRTITMPDHDVDLGALLTKADAFNLLVWTGYMQLACPTDSAFPNLGVAYQKLDILTVDEVPALRILTDAVNSRFQFTFDGVYRFAFSGPMEHNESNQGRKFYLWFYDATDDVYIGDPEPVGTGRNQAITTISINSLVEITDTLKDHWIEAHIGGGDSYTTVTFPGFILGINNVGEWREPAPV